jgi:pilus assembly protein CpaC
MSKNISLMRAAKTWSAIAMVGLAALPAFAVLTASAGAASAGNVNNDVNHTGILRIGFNEKLPTTRQIVIGLDKSMVVELPRDLKDVVVSNPLNLDAVVQTSNRVFLIGKKMGDANVFFFDENGEQVLTLEVRVERDMQVFDRMVERLIPGAHINSEILNDTIVLSGSVPNPADSARASEIAARFMQRPAEGNATSIAKVINMLRVEAKEQVMLKVTVAEVHRDAIKRLGINWNTGNIADTAMQFGSNLSFPVSNVTGKNSFLSGVVGPSNNLSSCGLPTTLGATLIPGGTDSKGKAASFMPKGPISCLAYTMEAFERTGLLKTLAEPTLTAISGETASFLAGGEFPVPVGQSNTGAISIQFKAFGVSLSFSPIVLSEGRINMKVATEVSELTNEGAVTLTSVTIPALKVRRANTTVELPSGGSLVIGGLISDDTRQNIDGIPGLKTLPILGSLFRSRDFQKRETELMVVVTPYMVNAVNRNKLDLPTDHLDNATDTQATLIGQLNKVYGKGHKAPAGKYHGNYGFIVE